MSQHEPAPGWIRDEHGMLRRTTKPHMGRRLPGFDYAQRRIYEITIVLEERRPLLGRLVCRAPSPKGDGVEDSALSREWPDKVWSVESSAWGDVVLDCWRRIPEFWPQVSLVESQLMPDHFHGVLFVEEALPKGKSLGSIIGGFKAGCTKGWVR